MYLSLFILSTRSHRRSTRARSKRATCTKPMVPRMTCILHKTCLVSLLNLADSVPLLSSNPLISLPRWLSSVSTKIFFIIMDRPLFLANNNSNNSSNSTPLFPRIYRVTISTSASPLRLRQTIGLLLILALLHTPSLLSPITALLNYRISPTDAPLPRTASIHSVANTPQPLISQ